MLNRARRARMIPFSAIRDDGSIWERDTTFESASKFLETMAGYVDDFRLDRQASQKKRLTVFAEAAGMVPQLARVSLDFSVPVFSNGGFDSTTDKYSFAKECADEGCPIEVLHIGDHDPSGAHLAIALEEDVTAFARALGAEVTFTRLAVTPQQIIDLRLPTAPAKKSDARAFRGETCQAEAIPPDVLADILRSAIEERIDSAVLKRVLRRERQQRKKLATLFKRIEDEL
jgi:hypothetical protein